MLFGNIIKNHKDFIPPFASLFSNKKRVNPSLSFVVLDLRQTGEQTKGRTDLTGKGVIEKKKTKTKMLLQQRKHQKCLSFVEMYLQHVLIQLGNG